MSAAVAGLVDTHSPAVAAATLVATGKINSADVVAPVLAALSTNTLSKIIVGWISGGPALSTNTLSKIIVGWISGGRFFALRLTPGLILVVVAAWADVIPTS